MMERLTEKQREVLEFIRAYVLENNFPPTAREIAARFGIAEKNAFYYLQVLERKGYIRRRRKSPRFLEFTAKARVAPVVLPLVGRVQAGKPVTALENREGELVMDRTLVGGEEVFLLRVKGDSMEGAHILEGDLVLVKPQKEAKSGDIVVARLGDEATVKRFVLEKGRVILRAENPSYEDIVVSPDDDFEIIGRVVGVFRKFS
ncbi:MAG: transcriptional repressor LexA [Deltaproteobacteria bacterium]|nr:MAG: transcriptional repressor LexA [Deltaproteobacteria bacterium]